MSTRFLTFHATEQVNDGTRMSPSAYYIDRDSVPIAVHIYAESAPTSDAFVDIFDDGVSIFTNRTQKEVHPVTGVINVGIPLTATFLGAGQNAEEAAQVFIGETIEEGSWIHATLKCGGGRNFSVQMEVFSDDEDESEEE